MLDEMEAARLVEVACERQGGKRMIVGSPRHPFSLNPTVDELVDGRTVTIHYSEISSPAIAMVGGWTFEVREDELIVLQRPRTRPTE